MHSVFPQLEGQAATGATAVQPQDDTELFSTGTIDSFAMVELLVFLEGQIGSKLGPEDISLDNFDTLGRILAFAAARAPA